MTSMYVASICFSAIAIGVALAGLSAVWITYGASQRRARSIRLALGARPTALVGRAVTRDLLTVSAGTIFGGLLAGALMAFASSWSDEVSFVD